MTQPDTRTRHSAPGDLRRVSFTLAAAWTLGLTGCREASRVLATGTVTLEESVLLAAPAGATDLKGDGVARATSGAYATITLAGRGGGVAVFDSAGGFVKELGQQGRGPGEFSDIRSVGFGPGDTLWVVEIFRAHAFTPPPELRFVREVNFGAPAVATVTANGFLSQGVVTSAGLQSPTLRGWDGSVTRQFTMPSAISGMEAGMGPVALAGADAIWIGHGERYEVLKSGPDGSVSAAIRRELDWFPPDEKHQGALNVVRPPARLRRVAVDAEGRVVVVSRRAHRNWTPMANPGPASGEPAVAMARRGSLARMSEIFEYVLEVFGPDGTLIASTDLPDGVQGLLDAGTAYQVLEDEDGQISLRLWRLKIQAP